MDEAYTGFAFVYDMFMDTTPYEKWGSFLSDSLKEYGICDGIVLDLGCGTGVMTEYLAKRGYDMIGVDNSYDMLDVAAQKQADRMGTGTDTSDYNILYLCQDMREFELYGTVAAVYSICDSINYITEPKELQTVFELVNNYLDPGGLFIFDFNTEYKYREVIGDTVIAENREAGSFIWENAYDEETKINEYDLTIFVPGTEKELYEKHEEVHFQRGYTLEEMKKLLKAAGMIFEKALDADTQAEVTDHSERIYVFARECGK